MTRFIFVACLILSRLAVADGVPTPDTLVYSGVALGPGGTPLAGTPAILVGLWDAASGGAKRCDSAGETVRYSGEGRFSVNLPTCTTVVSQSSSLFVEVWVNGVALPRTKIAASPYAVEALRSATTSQILTGNTTLQVGPGRQFATLGAALRWLDDRVVRGRLTIRIDDGNYSEPNTLVFDHPDGARVSIVGSAANSSAVTITFSSNAGLSIGPHAALAGLEGLTLRKVAAPGQQYIGISIFSGSHANLGPRLRVEGFNFGVQAETNSSFAAEDVVVVGTGSAYGVGFQLQRNSAAYISNSSASQVYDGYQAVGSSGVDSTGCTVTNVTEGWRSSDNASMSVNNATFATTATTFYAAGAGVLRAPTPLPAGANAFPSPIGSVGGQNAYIFQ